MTIIGPAEAFHSIQDRGRGIISLRTVDKDLPEQAHGLASSRLKRRAAGFYALSLATFNTNNAGNSGFTVRRSITNLAQFNKIIVTSEETDDFDPTPNGPVLLEGQKN